MPELKKLAPHIKKIKLGDAELELKEKIEVLGKELEKAQDSAENNVNNENSSPATQDVFQKVSAEAERLLEEAGRNPQATLLLLSAKIEEQLRRRIEEAGIEAPRTQSIIRYAEIGVKYKIFPGDFLPAFRDFASVRNRVAHGQAFDVDNSVLLSVISIGTDLLKIASTVPSKMYQDHSTMDDYSAPLE